MSQYDNVQYCISGTFGGDFNFGGLAIFLKSPN